MEQPKVVLVTGIMASGKSTVAQLLAERLPRSAHVRGDAFRRMIVNGGVDIVPEGGTAMDEELRLRYRIAAQVADEYVRAGFTAVVQDVVLGPSVPEFVGFLESRPVAVVVLAPRPEVVAEREGERPKSGYVDWTVKELDDYLRAETPRIGLWLDTSDQTPDQTVDEILARMSGAILD